MKLSAPQNATAKYKAKTHRNTRGIWFLKYNLLGDFNIPFSEIDKPSSKWNKAYQKDKT